MSNRISQALNKLFEKHRIVFWYDVKNELRDDFEGLNLSGIEKIELTNNEFGVKYRVLREEPEQKFLLYREGPEPERMDNWMLDVQLAHAEFRTDQSALWLAELELGMEFSDLVQEHEEFFKAVKRKDDLKSLLKPEDTHSFIRTKMLAVCAGCTSDPRIDASLEHLLAELAAGGDEKIRLIERCNLDGFLWDRMNRYYGYKSDEPGIHDFVIELFKSCYAMGTDGDIRLSSDALVFLRRWKDSRQYEASFESLSKKCADTLGIEQDLHNRDFRTLIDLDYFSLIDEKIIYELVQSVVARTVSTGDVALWVRQRRQSHWYGSYQHLYEAIDFASQFFHMLDEATLEMDSMADGVQRYSQSWFRLDQLYRKFTYHVRCDGRSTTLLSSLIEKIENLYSNNYLLKLNDRWQIQVDSTNKWNASPVLLQKNFFESCVQRSPKITK